MTRHETLPDDPRLLELLADRALFGLTIEEEVELERAAKDWPAADLEALDRTAARVERAVAPPGAGAALPEKLRGDVLRQAEEHFRAVRRLRGEGARGDESSTTRTWAGWIVAFAAGLLAVLGWWPRFGALESMDVPRPDSAFVLQWGPGGDPRGEDVAGELWWSNTEQRGEMTFAGLAPNDPTEYQYQLWIFDKTQDEATPIDGGVFDVSDTGEAVVPIDAKLKIVEPYLFAVTVEKPGGVVVSDKQRIAAAAAVPE